MHFDGILIFPQLFELLLALASVPTIRLMMATMVFAPVPTKEEGEQELLQHIFYLAKRSVTVDNGASVSAIKLITYIYEVGGSLDIVFFTVFMYVCVF